MSVASPDQSRVRQRARMPFRPTRCDRPGRRSSRPSVACCSSSRTGARLEGRSFRQARRPQWAGERRGRRRNRSGRRRRALGARAAAAGAGAAAAGVVAGAAAPAGPVAALAGAGLSAALAADADSAPMAHMASTGRYRAVVIVFVLGAKSRTRVYYPLRKRIPTGMHHDFHVVRWRKHRYRGLRAPRCCCSQPSLCALRSPICSPHRPRTTQKTSTGRSRSSVLLRSWTAGRTVQCCSHVLERRGYASKRDQCLRMGDAGRGKR